MIRSSNRDVRLRLCLIYAVIVVVSSGGMLLSGRFISRDSPESLLQMTAGLLAGNSVLLLSICVYTWLRLKARPPEVGNAEAERKLWVLYTGFPKELFWLAFVAGMLLSQIYHFAVLGLPPWTRQTTVEYAKSSLFNLTTFFALSLLYYSAARWILHPYLRGLKLWKLPSYRFRSALWNVMFALLCGLIYMLIRMYWYAVTAAETGQPPQTAVLAAIGLIVLMVTLLAVYLLSYYLLRDMELMTAKLHGLANGNRDQMLGRLPIASPYEAGELTMAFNRLQARFEQEYARLNQDIQLGVHVQSQLLSRVQTSVMDWRLHGECVRIKEVGGGFYDVAELANQRMVIAAGCVTGEPLPSALVMSSILMLLRTQVEASENAAELLRRVSNLLNPIVPEGMEVHIAIGLFDQKHNQFSYALAGQMTITVEQGEQRREQLFSGVPNSLRAASQQPIVFAELPLPCHGLCEVRLRTSWKESSQWDYSSITAFRTGGTQHETAS